VAQTPEARFSARVRDGLGAVGCDVERIENRVNLGVSDMVVGVGSRYVTIELKAVTAGLKVTLRPHQIAFLLRHGRAGRPAFVLVWQAARKDSPDFVHLYRGRDAIALAESGLRLMPMAAWPSRGLPWQELKDALIDDDYQGAEN